MAKNSSSISPHNRLELGPFLADEHGMRTAPHRSSSPAAAGNGKPRFKCSERVVVRRHGEAVDTQCLEIGEDTILLEAEHEFAPSDQVEISIPSQRIRRDGVVKTCDLEMGMFRVELDLVRGQVFDPIAITMYPLLHGPK